MHLHARHSIDAALDAAHDRFARQDGPGTLWLVESAGEGAAERLRDLDRGRSAWGLDEVSDVTWRLRRSDDASLTLIRGRQVATVEGLEVLIVGTAARIPDGSPLLKIVESWLDREVLVMIPWGFGKWTGRRGRRVADALDEFAGAGLRLSDTAARPEGMPTPRLLARQASAGRLVPLGSDPFPFPGRHRDVGRFGFVVPDLEDDADWPAMLQAVRTLDDTASSFGSRVGPVEFATLQLRMQLRKRLGRA